jgi:hypothetical protein
LGTSDITNVPTLVGCLRCYIKNEPADSDKAQEHLRNLDAGLREVVTGRWVQGQLMRAEEAKKPLTVEEQVKRVKSFFATLQNVNKTGGSSKNLTSSHYSNPDATPKKKKKNNAPKRSRDNDSDLSDEPTSKRRNLILSPIVAMLRNNTQSQAYKEELLKVIRKPADFLQVRLTF